MKPKSTNAKTGRVIKREAEKNPELWEELVNEIFVKDYNRICQNLLRGIDVEQNLAVKEYIKTIGGNIKRLVSASDKMDLEEERIIKEKASSDVLNRMNIG